LKILQGNTEFYHLRRRRRDLLGNHLEIREISSGRDFLVVKNFPKEDEIIRILEQCAREIEYVVHPEHHSWSVRYRVKK